MLNSLLPLFCADAMTSSLLTKPIQTSDDTYTFTTAVQPSKYVDEESHGESI